MNIFDLGITSVASITVVCFLLAEGIKAFGINEKWLPTLCGLMGGILGVPAYLMVSGFPANDFFTAVVVGIVSGLAATGAHQVYKQAMK